MEDSLPLKFNVKYRLGEYLEIVRCHAFATNELKGFSGLQKRIYSPLIMSIATALFFYKSWRVGVCSFIIDAAAITRQSKDGSFHVPWTDVTAIHDYRVGYLIEKGEGAMPIPFRVLSPGQRNLLAELVAPHLSPAAT